MLSLPPEISGFFPLTILRHFLDALAFMTFATVRPEQLTSPNGNCMSHYYWAFSELYGYRAQTSRGFCCALLQNFRRILLLF